MPKTIAIESNDVTPKGADFTYPEGEDNSAVSYEVTLYAVVNAPLINMGNL